MVKNFLINLWWYAPLTISYNICKAYFSKKKKSNFHKVFKIPSKETVLDFHITMLYISSFMLLDELKSNVHEKKN